MAETTEAFVGIDVAKLRNAVAVADAGRDGEVRFHGEVDASPESMRRLAAKLAGKHQRLALLLRGRPDRLRPAPADHRPRPRLRRGRALADPEEAGRAGQDQPPRRAHPGAPAARRRADPDLGPGHRPRGGARPGAGARGRGGGRRRPKKRQVAPSCCATAGSSRARELGRPRTELAGRRSASSTRPSRSCCRRASRASRLAEERLARLDRADRGVPADLEPRAAGRGAAGAARRRPPHGGDVRGRGRRLPPLRQPAPADGLPRPGAVGALDRREGAARRDHQGRQRPGAAPAGRGRLDLPPPAAGGKAKLPKLERVSPKGPRDRVEGADPADGPLPGAHGAGQEDDRDLHRDRARDGRVHVGRSRGRRGRPDAGRADARGATRQYLAHGPGARPRRGTLVRRYVADPFDARWQTEAAPDEYTGMR